MNNSRVSVVQKARYGVLLIPAAWVLFSIWVVINEAFPRFTYTGVQETNTSPSVLEMGTLIYFGIGTIWIFIKMVQAIKNHAVVSAELKSGLMLFLGSTLITANTYLQLGSFLSFVGLAMMDIAAIIMIVTLLQGKTFGHMTLYYKDVQIRKTIS